MFAVSFGSDVCGAKAAPALPANTETDYWSGSVK